MSTHDAGGAEGLTHPPGEVSLARTQIQNATETPAAPGAASSTPGVALAGARVPGGPSLPDFDPMSLTRVISLVANELFAQPPPTASTPTIADTSALASMPSAPAAPAPAAAPPAPVNAPLEAAPA